MRVIAQKLIETETLEREEFEQLLVLHGIQPKKKKEERAAEQTAG